MSATETSLGQISEPKPLRLTGAQVHIVVCRASSGWSRYADRQGNVEVQVFGTKKSQDTRKALRFFSERRVRVHFVDLKERAASRGELTRFVQKFGVTALIDLNASRYHELGLGAVRYTDERWIQCLCDEPLVLRQPLVRYGSKLTVGADDATWKSWVEGAKRS